MRAVWCPFRGLCWLIDELSGEHRRECDTEARRQAMVNRPPLDEARFLAALSARPDLAATALAVRDAVAENCYLPAKALRPDDSRAELEALFRAPRDAPWFDLGGSWPEVLFGVERRLGVRLPVELLERPWAAALQSRRLDSLGQVIAFFADAARMAAARSETATKGQRESGHPE